jgi:hypothetical protein
MKHDMAAIASCVAQSKLSLEIFMSNRYFVEERPNGTYAVLRPHAMRASAICSTQREAIAKAKLFGHGHEPDVERVRNTRRGKAARWRKA